MWGVLHFGPDRDPGLGVEVTALAIANLAALFPSYRSKAESAWARIGAAWVGDWFQCPVVREDYEPETFNLPGNKYTPDFRYILSDGRIVFVEIKGSNQQKNYRDARSKLRLAASVHPFFHWCEARQAGRGAWDFEEVKENQPGAIVYLERSE